MNYYTIVYNILTYIYLKFEQKKANFQALMMRNKILSSINQNKTKTIRKF